MMGERLPAHVWVAAYIRRANAAHKPAMLVRRGDEHGGTILIRIDRLDGTGEVLSPSFGMKGERLWLRATGPAPVTWADTQAYIDRRIARDSDLWIIDIEARDGDAMLDEPIES